MTATFIVRKAAIFGAGVMGAQIAAHLNNANVETILFDLPNEEGGDINKIAKTAIGRLKKIKPSPLAVANNVKQLIPANYKTDLELLADCDLVIEAIAERLDWKLDLYEHVAPHLRDDVIIASNTSGLSINKLADALPKKLRSRFCGVHFFNPPRYMKLVEVTPSNKTDHDILPGLETFLVSTLGKGVVYAKDTPNFVANRIGVFSMLSTLYHADKLGIPFEVVDALTGPLIGRAKSATYRTMDVVGLDVMKAVVQTMADNLPGDPWLAYFHLPEWLNTIIDKGVLGQKSGFGVYKKQGKIIHVLDVNSGDYRPADQKADEEVLAILKIKDPQERFAKLQACEHVQARFIWACFRDLFHYSAYHLENIADTVRDLDLAIRWGFGWQQGPFEIWQCAGWETITQSIQANIEQNSTMVDAPLPAWLNQQAVYTEEGAYSPSSQNFKPRSDLPVYKRQIFPQPVLAEQYDEGETIFENDGIRLWHRGDKVAIASFKTKMNTISVDVLLGLQQSLKIAEQDFKGMVLWQRQGDHFSVGADLSRAAEEMATGKSQAVEYLVKTFQETSLMLRYSQIPTVAALRGYVFGGGCELTMHCDRAVAALESYVGLVEAGVGLLPAGGGCKEFALRASQLAASYGEEPFRYLQHYLKMLAMAEVSASAQDAVAKHYLRDSDCIVFNTEEVLHVAIEQAKGLYEAGYRPPVSPKITVAGKDGIATAEMLLINYLRGGFISEHDFHVGMNIAKVLCGGDIEGGTIVDEHWFIALERELFLELANTEKTQARIIHTLKTGKPLRN